jgi:uncharacterized protein with HEPN domain
MSRDDATLVDIVRAARLAVEFLGDYGRDDFFGDAKTQSAILHQLLLLGEAVKRLSDEFRARHEEVPWKMMAGMRDKLIHEYEAVDLEEVWNTVTADIPRLLERLGPLAPAEGRK